MFNWLFKKRYFVEYEYTDEIWVSLSGVKTIKANTEEEAREKFDWWAFRQRFIIYSIMHIREVGK